MDTEGTDASAHHKVWLAGLGALAIATEAAAGGSDSALFRDLSGLGHQLETRIPSEQLELLVTEFYALIRKLEPNFAALTAQADAVLAARNDWEPLLATWWNQLGKIVETAIPKEQLEILATEVQAAVPSAAETSQLQRNAQARRDFLAEFETLTSRQVAELAGSRATNQAALANRWKAEGRIFAVEAGGQTLFPAFQFADDDGRPVAATAEVLAIQPSFSGWQTALWFTGRNGWLGARRPVDLLKSDPAAVVEAARREAEAFD